MPIQITEAGVDFIRQCLQTYQGETWFLLLFAGAMLLLFWLKDPESRTLRLLLWPYFTVLVCTVYNILIMQVFIRKLNLSGEYYRFFWLLPLGIVIPYVCTRLTASGNGRMKKILVFLLLTIVIAAAGAPAWSRKLEPDGWLAYEIGQGQEESVGAFLEAAGLVEIGFRKDLGGVIRVVFGRKPL